MIELLYGLEYWRTKKFINSTEYLSVDELNAIQFCLLRSLCEYSCSYLKFYNSYPSVLQSDDINNFIYWFKRLPILDKTIVRSDIDLFLARSSRLGIRKNTGGSTGEPFVFYLDRFVTRQREKAFIFDQWGRVGYTPGDLIFNLRGSMPGKGFFVKHDHIFNVRSASSIDMSPATVHRYVSYINKTRPSFIQGYPSTIYQLALLMNLKNQSIDCQIKAVFCGSEKLFQYQRDLISRTFNCRVFSWYGHSEYQVLAGECECSNKLHIYPQYGYTELIPCGQYDEDGKEIFEIVATGFNNRFMPLLRYRTCDYVIPSSDQQCDCGRSYYLIDDVIGRVQEFVVDRSGNLISVTPLIYGQHYNQFEKIYEFQIIQKVEGEILFLIDKASLISERELEILCQNIQELVCDRLAVSYKFTDAIEKSKIGKRRTVVQYLNINNYL